MNALISLLSDVVDEFRAKAEVATEASLDMSIFLIFRLGTRFAVVTGDCGQAFPYVHHIF